MADMLRAAEDALTRLKDAFVQLDSAQREAKLTVAGYETYLADRARRSSLVPRHRDLDQRADAIVMKYLTVLDEYPIEPRMRASALAERQRAYRELEPRLRAMHAEIQEFLERHTPELERVGAVVAEIDQHKEAAAVAIERAHDFWQRLRDQGFEPADAEHALARARIAGSGVEAWNPERGLAALRDAVDLVLQSTAVVEAVAEEFPNRVRRAQSRSASLSTRLEAMTTRTLSIPDSLRALRREFSAGNWQDLEDQQLRTEKLISKTRESLQRFEEGMATHRWEMALQALGETEMAVQAADEAVDAAADRLRTLREIKQNPPARLDRAKFIIRDAQMLVMRGPAETRTEYANALDRLVLRLDRLGRALEAVHPNYWSVLGELDYLQSATKELVGRYREDQRRHAPPREQSEGGADRR